MVPLYSHQILALELLFTGPAEQHPSVHARAAQNELKLGQDFTLSSSRPSQSIPGMILRLVRSGLHYLVTLFETGCTIFLV